MAEPAPRGVVVCHIAPLLVAVVRTVIVKQRGGAQKRADLGLGRRACGGSGECAVLAEEVCPAPAPRRRAADSFGVVHSVVGVGLQIIITVAFCPRVVALVVDRCIDAV